MTVGWSVEHLAVPAGEAHARDLPRPPRRTVWIHRPASAALVLGSRQPESVVDLAAAGAVGIDVVRRRSGGGAVLVEPGAVVWIDVVLPPGDPLAEDDVGRAPVWVGEVWAAALVGAGGAAAHVHRGGMVPGPWSELVCFGGLGPGELTVAGRKVVGIAQRRTRDGTWFQTAALLRWDAGAVLDLLSLGPGQRARARVELAEVAVGADVDAEALVRAFVASLP